MERPMYGYIRITGNGVLQDEIGPLRHELAVYARREGFALGEVFAEALTSTEPAFDRLIAALRRDGVRDIIVPSLWHFARLPGLQEAMRQHIEHETGARIWVVQGQRS
ncbi:hypothetical protein BTM25_24280 [Actinomadura rubteroloni]|uniref:Recombinase family protein n=1 Tax=Actinomadura rubteroloni TaxID=1926885 RepID=A0A2P4UFJ5_9ACTN|nr:recombinase family protein [Actinomadura rubteroloni]POM23802.1 hypothetical protein BTM25_24280 [Actinomadura rubteroloni]